jgi:hypothetical protein
LVISIEQGQPAYMAKSLTLGSILLMDSYLKFSSWYINKFNNGQIQNWNLDNIIEKIKNQDSKIENDMQIYLRNETDSADLKW